jgi:hypothetical protein
MTRKKELETVPAAKIGRPQKLVEDEATLKQIKGLAGIQCTQKEAASVLGVCENTFNAFLRCSEKSREAWELGREEGKASLRRLQWATAQKSTTMQIWLGKQYLEQRDKMEESVTATVAHSGAITTMPDLSNVNDAAAALRAFEDFRQGGRTAH